MAGQTAFLIDLKNNRINGGLKNGSVRFTQIIDNKVMHGLFNFLSSKNPYCDKPFDVKSAKNLCSSLVSLIRTLFDLVEALEKVRHISMNTLTFLQNILMDFPGFASLFDYFQLIKQFHPVSLFREWNSINNLILADPAVLKIDKKIYSFFLTLLLSMIVHSQLYHELHYRIL